MLKTILFGKLFVVILAKIMVLAILFGKKFVLIAPKLPKTMHSVREIVCVGQKVPIKKSFTPQQKKQSKV